MSTVAAITRRRWHAPQEPYTALVEPPPFAIAALLQDNGRSQPDVDVAGISLHELAAAAREQLYRDAIAYTRGYRDVASFDGSSQPTGKAPTLILSGHQPELFHPGVWFKNFALAEFAREHGAHGIHLLIDNDLCRRTAIRVPTGRIGEPATAEVPLDAAETMIPYEERSILDRGLFASFASRVQSTIREIVPAPLVTSIWPQAMAAARQGRPLGQALARARHQIEQSWGLETLELPLSTACDTTVFRRFVLCILARLDEFHRIHNDVLRQYRRVSGIRSATHPVPMLRQQDGWLETPFWFWTKADPTRRALFARRVGGSWQLQGRESTDPFLVELDSEIEISTSIEKLAEARAQGVKLRPRALLTTMYARLFLSDLFLHGIGGAKYDELTDAIIREFWQVEPPSFVVLTATIPLPVSRPTVEADDIRRLDGLLRDLWYHPEQHLNLSDAAESQRERAHALATEKSKWIRVAAEPGQGKLRHDTINSANEELRTFVAPLRDSLLGQRQLLVEQLRHTNVLSSREYSFCLFPADRLRHTLLDLLH